jgi:hypothetical protein
MAAGDDMLLAAFLAQAQLPTGTRERRSSTRIFRAALMRAKL